ncbi:hypothetical protein [Lactobacillus delbrueckii]|uniref:hypothetical protein n=1 Tax=Lactobacillus delbrueckii TaxID=1584 RepID=UPI001A9283A1|nr:hypothetical protein [Lactobacillus delbrueckii]
MNKDKINPSTLIGVGILRKFALAVFWIILDLQNSYHVDIRGHLYQGSGRLKALGKSYFLPRLPGGLQRCCPSGKLAQLGLKSSLSTASHLWDLQQLVLFGVKMDCSAK